eukprot:jgi/Chrzof1/10283/Cz04g35170.t1
MAEQQLLQLNKEIAELRSKRQAVLADLKATTDPDMKKFMSGCEYTRLVHQVEQLNAMCGVLETRIKGVLLPVHIHQ